MTAISPQAPLTATAIGLTIAGSDSGGGAGVQADIKTFSALGVYGASVIAAVTAQNTRAVTAVHELPVEMIVAQLQAVFDDIPVACVKIGMLASPAIIHAVADQLTERAASVPVVLDPVMIAKSGDPLLQDDAVATLRDRLLPLATVLTPNLPEAARLLGPAEAVAADRQRSAEQGAALLALGPKAVLMKGGHATGDECVDQLLQQDAPTRSWSAPRVDTDNTHGTGCTLSAAIAAGLAKGLNVVDAVGEAHAYLQGAINAADTLQVGTGHGPVHHFYRSWTE